MGIPAIHDHDLSVLVLAELRRVFSSCALSFALLACLAPAAGAQEIPAAVPDGTIVEQARCGLHEVSYDEFARRFRAYTRELLEREEAAFRSLPSPTRHDTLEYEEARQELLARRPPPRAQYDAAFHSGRYECSRIRYLSDGLRVAGFLYRPTNVHGEELPVILFNRGGNGEFGRLTEGWLMTFLPFLDEGFVIAGSQYRGNGGEGQEEFGGADVRDVLNLIPLVRTLEYAGTGNVFLWGHSRGGMMTSLALKHGIAVNAAVVGAGPTDLEAGLEHRPLMEEVYAELMPDYQRRKEEHLCERSALFWAERISAPVLILHGTADWRVDPTQSLRMALRLQELGKEYELVIYAGDDHALSRNREDVERRILRWFRTHMRPPR